jgi:hypothetical protein
VAVITRRRRRDRLSRAFGTGVYREHPCAGGRWPHHGRRFRAITLAPVATGKRRLYVGAWKHGVSVYGSQHDRGGGFSARHPQFAALAPCDGGQNGTR